MSAMLTAPQAGGDDRKQLPWPTQQPLILRDWVFGPSRVPVQRCGDGSTGICMKGVHINPN